MEQVKDLRSVSDYETSIDLIADPALLDAVDGGDNGSFSSTWHRLHHNKNNNGNVSSELRLSDELPKHGDHRVENRICCFLRIDRFPPVVKFFLCSGGIFAFFMVYGYVQVSVAGVD